MGRPDPPGGRPRVPDSRLRGSATPSAHPLPTGTVTFLFTDIEGSTLMVQRLGDRWAEVLRRHDEILTGAIEGHGGRVVKSDGDSFFAVFEVARDAAAAAVAAQRSLAAEAWAPDAVVKVRMGLHTGVGSLGGSDYFGLDVHRASRIADSGHGGQVVMSEATAILVERELPEGTSLHDLGKHRFKDLSDPESILQLVVEELDGDFPPLRTLDAIPNNLPVQLTSFVGREKELVEAIRLLGATRVLTLTGPGGTGKTRLALQLAGEASDQFADGVFFVDLSPVPDASVVPSAILSSMGLAASSPDESPTDRLLEQLRPLEVLLVMDNFEHVVDAAPVVSSLIRSAPKVKLVVTSRIPLRLHGEQEMPVPPLAFPPGDIDVESAMASEGVRLLVERTRAVRPDFEVTPTNVAAVVELVDRLDGLPLAIELVASRLRLFPVETVLERLDTRMLSSGSVDLPERQRTIRNTIAWSYDLLDPPARSLLNRMSVFSGWWRLEEAEALCLDWDSGIDLVDGLESLVDQNLLFTRQALGSLWFRMLHVIREYTSERLEESGEAAAARDAHLRVFRDLVLQSAPESLRARRLYWFDLLEANHDNIRAAIDWGLQSGATEETLELAAAAWRFWQARGHLFEAQKRVEGALAMDGGAAASRARAMEALGGILWWRGRMEECLEVYREVLAMHRHLGHSRDLGRALYNYGLAHGYVTGEFEVAEAHLDEGAEVFRSLGDEDGLGDIAWGRGNNRLATRRLEEAYPLYLEAADRYRRAGNEFGVGWALFEAGFIKSALGSPEEAWPFLQEALELFWGHRDVSGVLMILFQMAGVALGLGDQERSHRLVGVVDELRRSSGVDIVGVEINAIEGIDLDGLSELTGEAAEVVSQGRAMSIEDAVAYALAGPTDS